MTSILEKMQSHLINEDRQGAEQLFHEYVVQRSREIYESLLEDDLENDDEELDGIGGDPTDDLESDLDDEEMGDDEGMDDEEGMGEDDELEDRVLDLEDALDDLKAEFERIMSEDDDEFGDEDDEEGDDEFGDEEGGSDEFDDEEMDDEEGGDEELKDSIETMREYVEKVAAPKPGDNGQNTRSTVANKNDMGGKTDNIAKNSESKGSAKKTTPKVDDAGNQNKPGGRASKLQNRPSTKMGPTDSAKSMLGSKKKNNG